MEKTCKGSMSFGTGCGKCNKCLLWKRDSILKEMQSRLHLMVWSLEDMSIDTETAEFHIQKAAAALGYNVQSEEVDLFSLLSTICKPINE